MTRRPCITACLQEYRRTRHVFALVKVLILVVRQHRTLELLYGGYCNLVHRPSRLRLPQNQAPLNSILNNWSEFTHGTVLSRGQLLERYGAELRVDLLPDDFNCARCEAIYHDRDTLVIGEYGENSRIAWITPESCTISDYYQHIAGVRHIHAIHHYKNPGEFLVSTGDSSKVLDLWVTRDGNIRFDRRLCRQLAGFTAAVKVNGEYYFGSDFSGRPNFIRTLGGAKYFFPPKSYKLFVTHFYSFLDRYIVSINSELPAMGGRKAVSVFDTVDCKFIFCDYAAREAPALLAPPGHSGRPTLDKGSEVSRPDLLLDHGLPAF
jgi:hypothetical protein